MKKFDHKVFSIVIPAYNEEKGISRVLNFFRSIPEVHEIIVVDDASSDNTRSLCKGKKTILVSNTSNQGKTKSVLRGIKKAEGDIILLADADLIGLDTKYILDGFKLMNNYDTVLIDYGAQDAFLREIFAMMPAETGVRFLRKKDIKKIAFPHRTPWEIEPVLNRYYLSHKKKIAVISSPKLRSPYKHEKYSFWNGMWLHFPALWQILTALGTFKIHLVWLDWFRIRSILRRMNKAHKKKR